MSTGVRAAVSEPNLKLSKLFIDGFECLFDMFVAVHIMMEGGYVPWSCVYSASLLGLVMGDRYMTRWSRSSGLG